MAIKAYFVEGQTEAMVHGLHQWDINQTLIIRDMTLPPKVDVHMACAGMSEAVNQICEFSAGCISACIPDKCLEQTTPVIAWVVSGGQTIRTIVMPVVARTKPADDYTPVEPFVEGKVVELDMLYGDQVIEASPDKTMDTVTIKKPANLKPSNIRAQVEIGGVVGTYVPFVVDAKLEFKEYNIIANGTHTITPIEGVDGFKSVVVNVDVPQYAVAANLQSKTVVENGEYKPDSGYDGFSSIKVNVPASAVVLQDVEVTPSGEEQIITHDTNHNGLGTVTVKAVELQDKTVTPSGTIQTITPDEGFTGLNTVTVEAVEGVTLQDKTVDPSGEVQTITADAGYNGLNSVTVEAVSLQDKTAKVSVDAQTITADESYDGLGSVTIEAINLQEVTVAPSTEAQTIMSDAEYDGIGIVTVGACKLQDKTVTPTTEAQTISADNGFNGLGTVTVEASAPAELQDKTVTPSTEAQTITADDGFDGLGTVTVEATDPVQLQNKTVTPSATAQTIKADAGYDGLGTVTVEAMDTVEVQDKTVTPSTTSQTITADAGYDALGTVTVEAITSSLIPNLTADNIVAGASILGVAGTAPTYIEVTSTSELDNYTSMPEGTLAIVKE